MRVELRVEGFPPVQVEAGATVLDACDEHELPMYSSCGGFAGCNACRFAVISGAENLTPQVPEEDAFLDEPNQRLGCQARLCGGVVSIRLEPGA